MNVIRFCPEPQALSGRCQAEMCAEQMDHSSPGKKDLGLRASLKVLKPENV